MNGLTLLNHISVISDPRQAWKVEHLLTDIISVMVTAVIAGDEGGKILKIQAKIVSNGYTSIMILGNGIPVHDTIA
ncbi:transposase family protein [Vibrio owensii]|uniref:transposase family protein n=1 Tax=Vibrio owensii TaxID=696485 RepID=UPI004067E453